MDAVDRAIFDMQRRLALAAIARGENVAANWAWLETHPEQAEWALDAERNED